MYNMNPYQQYQKQPPAQTTEEENKSVEQNANTYARPQYTRPEYTMHQPIITVDAPVSQAGSAYNPLQKYKEQSLSTLAPGELLVRLYDEIIKQMRVASLQIEKKDFESANSALDKCQTILATLESSLDMEFEISANLRDLYIFIAKQLLQANIKKDIQLIEECIPLVRDLRDSFDQADKESRKLQHSHVGGKVG